MAGAYFSDEADLVRAQALGARLRAVRHQAGLSLEEVEAASSQEFEAADLTAYEQGEHAIPLPTLRRLAKFYGLRREDLRMADDVLTSRGRPAASTPERPLRMGAPVTVWNRSLTSWTTGFQIAELLEGGYRLRRLSDGALLPEVIEFGDVSFGPL